MSLAVIDFGEQGKITLDQEGQWQPAPTENEESLAPLFATLANSFMHTYLPFSPADGQPGAWAANEIAEKLGGKAHLPEVPELSPQEQEDEIF